MRCLCLLVMGLWLGGFSPSVGVAQAIRLDAEALPLAQALRLFRQQTGIDLVYAERLVAGRQTTCRYDGTEPKAALDCLLRDTGLEARKVQPKQYVLLVAPGATLTALVTPRATLSGYVLDARTGDVLPGAHVYLASRRLGTSTNEAGYFALPDLRLDRLHEVTVSYLGYEPLDTLLAVGHRATVLHLAPTTFEAADVTVEAARERRADLIVEPGVIAAPVAHFVTLPSALGGQDLFQALRWMPGVQSTSEVGGGLIIRGSGPDQHLYLLDGAPVYHPWHAFSLISTFQTDTFKDIRLYRGAYPAEYDGRLAAVLDVELKDGNRTAPRATGAVNPVDARFVIESPITPRSSFMLAGRRSYLDKLIGRTHPVSDGAGRRDTLRTGYYFYDWSGKLTVRTGTRSRLAFSSYRGRDRLDLRLPFDLSRDFSAWLRPADLLFEVDQAWGNTLYSARYQYLLSDRLFFTTTVYQTGYRAREATFLEPTNTTSVDSDYRVNLRDRGVKMDVDYYPTLRNQLRTGFQVVDHRFYSMIDARIERSAGLVDSLADESQVQAVELVAYVQNVWQPTARWKVQPGVRLGHFSSGTYTRLSPRLSLQYAVHPRHLVLRGAATSQVQYLQRLRDRYSFLYDLVSSRWVPADGQVRPSRSGQLSMGLESQPVAGLTLTADAYWRGARHVPLPRDQYQSKDGLDGPGIEVGTLLGQYTLGRERAYGLELAVQMEQGLWRLWLGYAGGRARSLAPETGETAYRPARYEVPRSATLVLQRAGRRWQYGLAALVRSGYPLTVPVARYEVGSPLDPEPRPYLYRPQINNGRLPPYARLDATLGYRFHLAGVPWRAQVQVYNLLNRRNIIGRLYDPQEGLVRERNRFGVPLLPLLELEIAL